MNPHLLLRLPESEGQPVYWLLWQQDEFGNGSVAGDQFTVLASGTWTSVTDFMAEFKDTLFEANAELVQSLASFPATVLVPASCVTLHALAVQGRLTPSVRQSLIWRLEEEVSEDGDNFHLSVLTQQDDQVQVALVRQTMMTQWQVWLQAAGVPYRRWCSDALMLPWQEGDCAMMSLDNLVIARFEQWQTGCCEAQWQPIFEDSLRQLHPEIALSDIDTSGLQSPMQLFVEQVASTRFNLLQGTWQLPSPWKQYLRPLLPAVAVGSILLTLMMVNMLINIHQLDQQAINLQQQAQDTYLKLFPGERIVSLQAQMRQKLAALQPVTTESQTLPQILVRITPVLKAFPALKANALSYDSHQQKLHIQAEATSFEFFSQLRERFQQEMDKVPGTPLTLTINALEQVGKKVNGQLVISGESS